MVVDRKVNGMKKLIAAVLICCIALGITACQGKTNDNPVNSIADSSSVSISEEKDEASEDNQSAEETSMQEPDSQSPDETPTQQSASDDPVVYMTTDISSEALWRCMRLLAQAQRERLRSRLLRANRGATI